MKDIGKILAYFTATVLLGALLAPPLHWAGTWVAAQSVLPFLAGFNFARYFDRAILVAAVVLLWPTVRWLDVRSMASLGLRPDPRRWQHLAFGFCAAAALFLVFAWLLLHFGLYQVRRGQPLSAMAAIGLSAAVVPLIEEFLFRGAILGLFRKAMPPWPALACVSAIFAIVHFLKPPAHAAGTIHWFSGFAVLPSTLSQFSKPVLLLAGFSTLFAVGWILGYATIKTHSLWMAIGLHAGWIITKMGFSRYTRRLGEWLPWFGSDILVGLGTLGVLLLTFAVVWAWLNFATAERVKPRG